MRKYFILIFCVIFSLLAIVSCSQSIEFSPEQTNQAEDEPKTVETQPTETTKQAESTDQSGDIRITDIDAVTNPTGTVTSQGCSGPRVELTITITNIGQDFPSDQMWEEWKELIANSISDIEFEDRSVFEVRTWVYFHGRDKGWEEFIIPILPKDLDDNKFRAGQTMEFDYSVDVTTWEGVLEEEYEVVSTIRQSSAKLPIETHNLLYEESYPLALPDITVEPGTGTLAFSDPGNGEPITGNLIIEVKNIGSAPTTGRVTMHIEIDNPDGENLAVWEAIIERPFLEFDTVTLYNQKIKAVPAEGAKATISLYMQCPSEGYNLVSDADQSNNRVILDIY